MDGLQQYLTQNMVADVQSQPDVLNDWWHAGYWQIGKELYELVIDKPAAKRAIVERSEYIISQREMMNELLEYPDVREWVFKPHIKPFVYDSIGFAAEWIEA